MNGNSYDLGSRQLLLVLSALFLLMLSPSLVWASRSGKKLIPSDTVITGVKEYGRKGFACLKRANGKVIPGEMSRNGKRFIPFRGRVKRSKEGILRNQILRMERRFENRPSTKLAIKLRKKRARYERISKQARRRVCKDSFGNGGEGIDSGEGGGDENNESGSSGGNPSGGGSGTDLEDFWDGSDDSPSNLDLAPYTGQFGMREAQILYSRFGFGGSHTELKEAVVLGLDGTVEKLLTWVDEPEVEAAALDIECDQYLQHEEVFFDGAQFTNHNRVCNPLDPNDFNSVGLISSYYYRFRHGKNPFFYKFFTFIHTERLTAQIFFSTDPRIFTKPHFNMLMSFAQNLDYAWYLRTVKDDALVAYENLDLLLNGFFQPGDLPNENFVRELLEIASMSPDDSFGNPNYGPFDIAELALAFTGREYEITSISVGTEEDGTPIVVTAPVPSVDPAGIAPGLKVVFAETPYEQVIFDSDDAVSAILNHPETYYHMAEELIGEYLHPAANRAAVLELAEMIHADGGLLHRAMRTMMKSEELYRDQNEKVLVKTPLDLLFGFFRQTRFPHPTNREVRKYISKLGQKLGEPGNHPGGDIFGWRIPPLAGEGYVSARREVFVDIANHRVPEYIPEEVEYTVYGEFIAPLDPELPVDEALVDHLSGLLGVRLNTAQREQALRYINYRWKECEEDEVEEFGCTVGEYFEKFSPFNPKPSPNWHLPTHRRVIGLAILLATLDDYQLK